MIKEPESDLRDGDLYLAGEKVQPGAYRDISTGRTVQVEREDTLPASIDGRVACYYRLDCTWAVVKDRINNARRHNAA